MSDPILYDRRIFAENLLRLMRERQERQIDLARLLNVSKSTVSSYCSAQQLPRMDKIEQLALHYGVSRAALLGGDASPAPAPEESPLSGLWKVLNPAGQEELLRYGGYLSRQEPYRQPTAELPRSQQLRQWLRPAALCAASPREGEDYVWIPRTEDCPRDAAFCLSMPDDSMEPYLPMGSLLYVSRDLPLRDYDVGLFLVDGQLLVRQWCPDYSGEQRLFASNPLLRAQILRCPEGDLRFCCLGRVHTRGRLPRPEADF